MNIAYYIAKRYAVTKSSNNAINIITLIAGAGVFAGALALFVVLSGFAGLKEFSTAFSNDIDPDLKLLPAKGKSFYVSAQQEKQLEQLSLISSFSYSIEERVLLDFKNKNDTPILKGVDTRYREVTNIDSALVYGVWLNQAEDQLVIGGSLSRSLSLVPFDYVSPLRVIVAKPGKGQITNPTDAFTSKKAIVSGIYSVNEELDSSVIYGSIDFMRDLLDYENNQYTGIALKFSENASEENVINALNDIFGESLIYKNRAQLNDKLYKMLNTENLALYLIFVLVVIVALFNLVGALIMAILDKREDIKTLYNLGITPANIKKIFMFQGSLISIVGGVLGLLLGVLIIWLQQEFALKMITPSLPYPVKIEAFNIILVLVTIVGLGLIASYIGASRVRKALV
ncbi:ABC transporter permease [Gangjinia marincola]|uniref:ABC transporter permease n=1 Tax=Gangjinia marincola TaxID=578463 RepID=A0ABN1MHP4_9FLAO